MSFNASSFLFSSRWLECVWEACCMSCISRSDVTQCATLELDKCLFQAPPPPPNERLDESSVRKPDRNIRLSQHQIVEAHESYTRGDSAPVCSMAARDAEVGRVYWGCYQHLASDTGTAAAAAAADCDDATSTRNSNVWRGH
mmetsp:Transcript_23027/g.33812  ORF Transcript_23027/g.33812 Transcript_23027/m.33812 type:complete len:142 (-) Transcript_23027:759-1184(-)